MAQNSEFLQDFQSSLDVLKKMNQIIQDRVSQKKNFSDNLLSNLNEIKLKIKAISEMISQFKIIIDNLNGQVSSNTDNVKDTENKIVD